MANPHGERESRLVALFDHLLKGMPCGTAWVECRRGENYIDSIISVKPSNARSAAFWVHIAEVWPGIDVSFGSGTTIRFNDRNFDTIVGLVRQLASAVIAGRCDERFGFLGIRGAIRVDAENLYYSIDFFHPRLVPKTVCYVPYVESLT